MYSKKDVAKDDTLWRDKKIPLDRIELRLLKDFKKGNILLLLPNKIAFITQQKWYLAFHYFIKNETESVFLKELWHLKMLISLIDVTLGCVRMKIPRSTTLILINFDIYEVWHLISWHLVITREMATLRLACQHLSWNGSFLSISETF